MNARETSSEIRNDTMNGKDDDNAMDESPATVSSVDATAIDEDAKSTSSAKDADANQPPRSVNPTFSQIFALIRGDIHLLLIGLLLMCVAEAASLAVPIIVARAYDSLQTYFYDLGINESAGEAGSDETIDRTTMSDINTWMGISMGVYLASSVASWIRGVLLGIVGERLVARLRKQVYESVLRQEIGFFDVHKTGEIVSRLGSDTQLLQQTVSVYVPESIIGFVKVIISIVLMFGINGKLTSMTLAGVLVLCGIAVPFGRKLGVLSKKYQDVLGDSQTRSTEALGSVRTVQGFAAEQKELKRYVSKIGDPDDTQTTDKETTYHVGVKQAVVKAALYSIVFGGAFGFLYCALWFGFYLVTIEGTLTLGGLTAFQSYIFIIGGAIGSTINNVAQVFSGIAACGRVFYLLERKPKIKNFDGIEEDDDDDKEDNEDTNKTETTSTGKKPGTLQKAIVPSSPMEGNIEFENVMFSYPSRPDVLVLNAFSIKLAKNTTTALVGSSGSGKSTVVSLIQRFYDVDAGTITLDGTDTTKLDLSWLRSQIGYVQQEPQLFGVTIRENLVYGLSEEEIATISQTELENTCRDANAHEFIMSWPDGYDTMVGERGITLSGGQKQRIAIARALLTKCRILLLDEATSALDAESEHEVQMAIENAMIGRTVVVVAHRLSTIQSADQIVVMDNRKIVGVGTHDQLLTGCRRYQDLIKRQSTITRDVSSGTLRKLLPADFSIDDE